MDSEWRAAVRAQLGKNMRRLRKMHDWTIWDVAKRTDISWHTINNWELGKNAPAIDMLIQLCRGMGWRLGDVLRGCNINGIRGDQKAAGRDEAADRLGG